MFQTVQAYLSCTKSGGEGKGKFTTLSIFIAYKKTIFYLIFHSQEYIILCIPEPCPANSSYTKKEEKNQAGLRIRSIFGRIRILQGRIFKTGYGTCLHSPRINLNMYIFYINHISSNISVYFFYLKIKKILKKFREAQIFKILYLFIPKVPVPVKLNIARVGSGSGENCPDPEP